MYTRMQERADIRHHLLQGNSILLLAPRRVGKTWLMHRVEEDMGADGWQTAFCDVEGLANETEFLRHLCQEIEKLGNVWGRVGNQFVQRLKQISGGNWSSWQEAIGNLDWKVFSQTLVSSLNERDQPTLLLIDEISLFVAVRLRQEQAVALDFLHHLRALRQQYKNVRWMLTGSIGLDVVARREAVSGALLGLTPFGLEPFSGPAAQAFLHDLCRDQKVLQPFELGEAEFAYLERVLGWLSPYYLEALANHMRPTGMLGPSGRLLATKDDIDRACDSLLAPQQRLHFAAWDEHIQKNFDISDENRLRLLLNYCASSTTGELFATLHAILHGNDPGIKEKETRDLLTVLIAGGYLVIDATQRRYRFRSGLVRRYWTQYHQD
jgi:hypothetical protein